MFGWFKKKKNIIPQKPKHIPAPPPIPQKPVSVVIRPTSTSPAVCKKVHKNVSQTQNVTPTDDGLIESVLLGYTLNDGIVGGLIGGNLAGGIIGDSLNTDEEKSDQGSLEVSQPDNNHSSSYESSSSYDSSSYDSGSSCDSSSSCGCD